MWQITLNINAIRDVAKYATVLQHALASLAVKIMLIGSRTNASNFI